MVGQEAKVQTGLEVKSECEGSKDIHSFGGWVRAWREYRGLSLSEMARKAGWDAQYQNLLEKESRRKKDGSPPMPRQETVKLIAGILCVDERDALLAAGYAPLDLRRSTYESAPRRRPDGMFVFLHLSDIHLGTTGDENPTTLIRDLAAKVESLFLKFSDYDARLAQSERPGSDDPSDIENSAAQTSPLPHPRQTTSKG